jgi:hypothetical protein
MYWIAICFEACYFICRRHTDIGSNVFFRRSIFKSTLRRLADGRVEVTISPAEEPVEMAASAALNLEFSRELPARLVPIQWHSQRQLTVRPSVLALEGQSTATGHVHVSHSADSGQFPDYQPYLRLTRFAY